MMEVIMRLSRGKRVVDDAGLVNMGIRTQGVTEGPVYNPYNPVGHEMLKVGTPHCPIPLIMNTIPEKCPHPTTLMPSKGYTFIPTYLLWWCLAYQLHKPK